MNQHDRDESRPESFTRGLGKAMGQEARSWLRWTLRGAVVGAIVLGGVGCWFFSLTGLWLGAGVGAIGGGLCAFFVYGDAASGF